MAFDGERLIGYFLSLLALAALVVWYILEAQWDTQKECVLGPWEFQGVCSNNCDEAGTTLSQTRTRLVRSKDRNNPVGECKRYEYRSFDYSESLKHGGYNGIQVDEVGPNHPSFADSDCAQYQNTRCYDCRTKVFPLSTCTQGCDIDNEGAVGMRMSQQVVHIPQRKKPSGEMGEACPSVCKCTCPPTDAGCSCEEAVNWKCEPEPNTECVGGLGPNVQTELEKDIGMGGSTNCLGLLSMSQILLCETNIFTPSDFDVYSASLTKEERETDEFKQLENAKKVLDAAYGTTMLVGGTEERNDYWNLLNWGGEGGAGAQGNGGCDYAPYMKNLDNIDNLVYLSQHRKQASIVVAVLFGLLGLLVLARIGRGERIVSPYHPLLSLIALSPMIVVPAAISASLKEQAREDLLLKTAQEWKIWYYESGQSVQNGIAWMKSFAPAGVDAVQVQKSIDQALVPLCRGPMWRWWDGLGYRDGFFDSGEFDAYKSYVKLEHKKGENRDQLCTLAGPNGTMYSDVSPSDCETLENQYIAEVESSIGILSKNGAIDTSAWRKFVNEYVLPFRPGVDRYISWSLDPRKCERN